MIRCGKIPRASTVMAKAVMVATAVVSAGCAGTGANDAARDTVQVLTEGKNEADRAFRAPFQSKEPIDLKQGYAKLGPAARPVDAGQLKVALERHVEGRRQKSATYVVAGANLTTDGRTRALVLFTSENFCQPQGCELAILEQGSFGWKSVATISRVRAPVLMAPTATDGWFDLWAATGRDADEKSKKKSFEKVVRLQHGPNGYPSTTTFAISSTTGTPAGQAIFQEADLDLPDKARFATAGRDPEHGKQKIKAMTPPLTAKP